MHGATFGSVPDVGAKTKNKHMKPIDFSHISYTMEEGRGGNSREDHPEARGVFPYPRPFQAFHIPEGDGELVAFGEALEGGLCRWVSL